MCKKCIKLQESLDKLYVKFMVIPSQVRLRYERLLWPDKLLNEKELERKNKYNNSDK